MNWIKKLWLALPVMALAAPALSQEGRGDVVYVPTPQVVVDEMLSMAKIGPKDFLIDLGSGDGRIVITVALERSALNTSWTWNAARSATPSRFASALESFTSSGSMSTP